MRGTLPVAFVVLKPDVDSTEAISGVASAVEKAVGTYARLGCVYVATALPKTRAGKVMRRLLREAAETGAIGGDVTGLEDHTALDAVLAAVCKT
ncbi:Acetyl-coenzyme A synthetase [compost metagenome]